jgi:hypothetical protein
MFMTDCKGFGHLFFFFFSGVALLQGYFSVAFGFPGRVVPRKSFHFLQLQPKFLPLLPSCFLDAIDIERKNETNPS